MSVATERDLADAVPMALRLAVREEVGAMFDDFRRFVDRRLCEISAEVHGATQLLDFSEANLSGQIAKIQEQIVAVVAAPAEATRNSGVELEAVVQATEQAATQIMEAAEAIGDWVRDGKRDAQSVEEVVERINAIFEACSFQDLTGQRIRRAIHHLQHVEAMLGGLAHNGELPQTHEPPKLPGMDIEVSGHDMAQAEIDRLLNDF
jgi:chemotaxis protein CheZ